MSLKEEILTMVDGMQADLVKQRRDIHRHPEPGWTEFRTAALVCSKLSEYGYEVHTGAETVQKEAMMGVPDEETLKKAQERAIAEGADPEWVHKMDGGRTGVVAVMHFGPGPVVALRCDMDSNDVTETPDPQHRANRKGFASVHPCAMHACGHDGHTTVGIAVAKILASLKDELQGTVKFVFQPAEEGVRGAHAMVEQGVVDDVDYMLGAHFGFKMKKTGTIACNVTDFLATSKYDAYFTGVPAHAGAAPEQGRNALLAAACASLNLHAISRNSSGTTRINVGALNAGGGRNVIPEHAVMKLETRGATTELDEYMSSNAERILKAAAAMYDVKLDIKKVGGAAGGSNSPKLAAYLVKTAEDLGIFDQVVDKCPFGASEDFSFFMERVQRHGGQAAYMMVGADIVAGHHDSHFDFDEAALGNSAKMLSYAVAGLLLSEAQ